MSNRLSAYLSVALMTAALAGCGGSSSSHANTTKSPGEAVEPKIESSWTEFFNGKTPAATKISLLQNGQQFAPVINAQAKSPLASQSSAQVTDVKLKSPSSASVTYTVLLAGKPALKDAVGTAVKVGNTWLVSDASFCGLLKLEGTAPPGCPKA